MDREQKINLERLNKDIYSEYGIHESAEFTYTRGPVSISTRDMVNPIGIDSNREEEGFPYKVFTFAATIANNWGFDGQIKEVKDIIVHVPASMELETGNPKNKLCELETYPGDAVHNNPQYRYYIMNRQALSKITFDKDRDYMTIICPVMIKA